VTEKSLVVQHNKIIEARYKLSVGEQRLIKLLVSMIEPEDEDFKPYTIRVVDLANLIGVKSGDIYPSVKRTTKRLIGNVLIFKGEDEEDLQVSWLSSAVYHKSKGAVSLRFDPQLKPFLLHLKNHFTAYELGNIIHLKRMYSIRIYELLKQYQPIGRRRFTLESLRDILMLDDGEYKTYNNFKKWVLLPSQKELKEKTDISFTWEEEKEWRNVVAIKFIIKSQKRPQGALSERELIKDAETEEMNLDNGAVSALVGLGITQRVAEELAGEYDEDYIQAKIAYAEAQRREGRVKSLPGFVVEAIRNGYRDSQAEERRRKEEAAKLEADKEARRREWEKMKVRWNAWKAERAEAHIAAMDAKARECEKAAWLASIADNFAMMNLVKKSRENEERHFRIYVAGKMDGLGLPEWVRAVGVDLSPFAEFARLDQL
jgi:plasmid replication initiation protein